MLSYIVALIAAVIFFADPISQLFWPHKPNTRLSPRPQLNESLLALDGPNDTAPVCPPDTYSARILSVEPLVVYLEGFLNEDERNHLLEISDPIFEPATITHDVSSTYRNTTVRDSSVALIPRTDPVRCIEARARAVQGWRRDVFVERLRTQRYDPGGHYSHHFDWSANYRGWGRVSSFMAWVDDGAGALEGGGTEFPLLETRAEVGGALCQFVECGERVEEEEEKEEEGEERRVGTVFKAVPGNAVYWENFAPDGRGHEKTWHAGLPVTKGSKVGLNIWSFGRIE